MVFRYLKEHVPGWDLEHIFTIIRDTRGNIRNIIVNSGIIRDSAKHLAELFYTNKCVCKTRACRTNHRLIVWNPSSASLKNFALQAVKGRAREGGGILESELAQAMVCQYLEGLGLEYGYIPYWEHPECEFAPSTKTAQGEEVKGNEFGTQCKCGADFDQYRDRLFVRRRWVSSTVYHGEPFWHCTNRYHCGKKGAENYYVSELQNCPLCGAARPERPSRVLVRNTARVGWRILHTSQPTTLEDRMIKSLTVRESLKSMDEESRELIIRHVLQGVSTRDIAQQLGLTETEVRNRLRRARSEFAKRYREMEGEDNE